MAAKANSAPPLKRADDSSIIVEQWPIAKVLPYDKNPRAINDKAIAKVAASIREYGFQQPIVVDKAGVIIVGHTRRKAAESLGLAFVPVVVADLPEVKARAYRLADNRTAQETSWLDDLLKDELSALAVLDFDMALTGFDERELDKLLMDDAELARAEETPPVPENPVTVKGDVWIMGKHRLVAGDCTVATDVEKCLNGVKPHLMVTDPPYGVVYDASWRDAIWASPDRAKGKVKNDDKSDWREAWALFPGDVAYCWHADRHASSTQSAFEACGFELRSQIIWAKQHFVVGRGHYHVGHEPCFYMVRKKQGATGHWCGARDQSTLWKIDKPQKSETGHSTQKPVECMLRPIKNNSSEGQAIYEPFSGSGTTIAACELSGRSCHAIEITEAYVDVAVLRWQNQSGEVATLEGDGRTFDEIKQERHGKEQDAA